MKEKYSMNYETLEFIKEFEQNVELGKVYSIQELVNIFKSSSFYKEQFDSYKKTPNNSMWYAIKRSGKWECVKKGEYKKVLT